MNALRTVVRCLGLGATCALLCAAEVQDTYDLGVELLDPFDYENVGTAAELGAAVAADGVNVFAGAPSATFYSTTGSTSGAGHVYRNKSATEYTGDDRWLDTARAFSTDDAPVFGDGFGASVSITGDFLVIGAPTRDLDQEYEAGAVYVVRIVGWGSEPELVLYQPASLTAAEHFGSSVSVSGTFFVAGAPGDGVDDVGRIFFYEWGETRLDEALDTNNPHVGRYYTDPGADDIDYSTWVSHPTWTNMDEDGIASPDSIAGMEFGAAVSMSGDWVVVGAPGADRAYVYKRIAADSWVDVPADAWQLVDRLRFCDGDVNYDGYVDQQDFGVILTVYDSIDGDGTYERRADLNADGVIDEDDLNIYLADQGCDVRGTGIASSVSISGEYIGICYDPYFNRIWTSYTGIDTDDPTVDQSMIWSSLIHLGP